MAVGGRRGGAGSGAAGVEGLRSTEGVGEAEEVFGVEGVGEAGGIEEGVGEAVVDGGHAGGGGVADVGDLDGGGLAGEERGGGCGRMWPVRSRRMSMRSSRMRCGELVRRRGRRVLAPVVGGGAAAGG